MFKDERLKKEADPQKEAMQEDDIYAKAIAQDKEELVKSCWERASPAIRKFLGMKEALKAPEKPDDYWRNWDYHRHYLPFVPIGMYMWLSMKAHEMVNGSDYFNRGIILTICAAGILVGAQTYDAVTNSPVTGYIDNVILGIFCLEALSKMCMEGLRPWMYFIGPERYWNCFDITIVILSFPVMPSSGKGIALLRLVRLARLGKLIKKIPRLQMIVFGIVSGLSSISYIMLLLVLVLYLYGVMGFYLFAVNDPFHFGTVPNAMFTLFRMATLENWGDITFLNLLGCNLYPNVYVQPEDRNPDNTMFWCRGSGENYFLGALYFVSFIIIAALVMLSLFIGVVCMSMGESLEIMKREKELREQEAALEKGKAQMEALKKAASTSTKTGDGLSEKGYGGGDVSSGMSRRTRNFMAIGHHVQEAIEARRLRKESQAHREMEKRMARNLKIALGSESHENLENELMQDADGKQRSTITIIWIRISNWCDKVVNHPTFSNIMTGVIIIAGLLVGIQTEIAPDIRYNGNQEMKRVFAVTDRVILYAFTVELILKMASYELKPWRFYFSGWNLFDLIIVAASFVPSAGSSITFLRLLRVLRVLKLVKRLPQLYIIVQALFMGFGSIGWIGLVLMLVYYVYAIIGIIAFSQNDPWHYGSLHRAFLSLFRCSTLDNWSEQMYINQYGCDQFPDVYTQYPWECKNPSASGLVAVVYMVSFVIICAQVILNLFIGVIATAMDEANERQAQESLLDANTEYIAQEMGLSKERVEAFYEVFSILDLDNGGTIQEEELRIGLEAIGVDMPIDEIALKLDQTYYKLRDTYEILDFKESAKPDGVDQVGFIVFMSLTPLFKNGSAVGAVASGLQGKGKKKKNAKRPRFKGLVKRTWFMQKVHNFVTGGLKAQRILLENDAAIVIQEAMRGFLKRREAKREVEKRKEMMMRKQMNQSNNNQSSP